jgi:hypothetical protein
MMLCRQLFCQILFVSTRALPAWLCLERYWAVTHARGGAQGRDDGRDDARNDLKSELPSFLTFHTSRI